MKKDKEIADFLGVPAGTFASWKSRGIVDIEILLAKCNDSVNWNYVLTGEGPMRRGDPTAGAGEGGYCYVPHYAVGASAGHGAMVEAEEIDKYLAFKLSWVHGSLRANPGDLFALNVKGDSMESEIRDGDTILVNRTRQRLIQGKVYLFTVEDTLLVKKYALAPDGPRAVSEEKSVYLSIPLRPEEFTVHGQVVWVGRVLA